MQEVFEKIIGKLEELRINSINEDCPVIPNSEDCEAEYSCSSCFLCKAIEIVKKAADEYNNGWIPYSKEKPKGKGEYSVSYPDGTVSIQYWDRKFFTEVDTVSGKSIVGQPVAWKQKDEPYHPKGE